MMTEQERSFLENAQGHLACAKAQRSDKDDKIIADHIEMALAFVRAALREERNARFVACVQAHAQI